MKYIIKFVTTPKNCRDCQPTENMLTRRGCAGCLKYYSMKTKEIYKKDNKN